MNRAGTAGLAGLWITLTAGSCATTGEPVIRTVTVVAPVPVSCVPAGYQPAPASPVTVQALRSAPDAAARYQLLAAFWTAETPVLALQSELIAACRAAAAAPHGRP